MDLMLATELELILGSRGTGVSILGLILKFLDFPRGILEYLDFFPKNFLDSSCSARTVTPVECQQWNMNSWIAGEPNSVFLDWVFSKNFSSVAS